MAPGRFVSDFEVERRRDVVVLGNAPATDLFPASRPDRQEDPDRRATSSRSSACSASGPAALGGNPDEFAVIPISTYDKMFQAAAHPRLPDALRSMIGVVPREGATREQLVKEIEEVMRVRHRLRLDQENDFDIAHVGLRSWASSTS